MTKEELKSFLTDEAEYTETAVESMTEYEMFDAWLRYQGMIGWTDDILDALRGCPDLLNEQANESLEENE